MKQIKNGKLATFNARKPHFVAEQIGAVENDLKKELVEIFVQHQVEVRAYLVQVEYDSVKDFNIALCLHMENGVDVLLVKEVTYTFRHMFNAHEHIDMFFLKDQ